SALALAIVEHAPDDVAEDGTAEAADRCPRPAPREAADQRTARGARTRPDHLVLPGVLAARHQQRPAQCDGKQARPARREANGHGGRHESPSCLGVRPQPPPALNGAATRITKKPIMLVPG